MLAALHTARRAAERETKRRALEQMREMSRDRPAQTSPAPTASLKTVPPAMPRYRQMTLGIRPRSRPARMHSRRTTAALDDGADPPGDPSPTVAELVRRFEEWRPGCTSACAVPGRHLAPCPLCVRRTARIVEDRAGAFVWCLAGHSHTAILAALEHPSSDVRGAA